MSLTLNEQRSIVIRHLPMALAETEKLLHRGSLASMIDSRLESGSTVFGDRMFSMSMHDAWHEFVEELADAVLYLVASLYAEGRS